LRIMVLRKNQYSRSAPCFLCLVDILLTNRAEFIAIWDQYQDECGVCSGRCEPVQAGSL